MCSFLLSAGPVSAFSSAPPFLSRLRCLKQPKRPQGAPPTWWPWPRHFWTKPSQANDKMSVRENSFQASGTPCGVRDVFNPYPGVSRCSTPGYCLSTLRVGEARQPSRLATHPRNLKGCQTAAVKGSTHSLVHFQVAKAERTGIIARWTSNEEFL